MCPPALRRRWRAAGTAHASSDRVRRRRPGDTAKPIPFRGTSYRCRERSILIPLIIDVVLILIQVIIILVFVLFPVLLILVVIVIVGLGPALRLLDAIQIHLVPGLDVKLLD